MHLMKKGISFCIRKKMRQETASFVVILSCTQQLHLFHAFHCIPFIFAVNLFMKMYGTRYLDIPRLYTFFRERNGPKGSSTESDE